MRPARLVAFLSAGLVVAACESPPEEPPEPTAADTVAMAVAAYDPAGFDSIAWDTPEDAIVRGSVVFQYSCVKCHGAQGLGDGEFVTRGDTLRPPPFNAEDWAFQDNLEGLRTHVFTGTEGGMPHWGLEGLKYRDVDAVARFILDRLTAN
jgi:mono/diheme cytochrome c family protein